GGASRRGRASRRFRGGCGWVASWKESGVREFSTETLRHGEQRVGDGLRKELGRRGQESGVRSQRREESAGGFVFAATEGFPGDGVDEAVHEFFDGGFELAVAVFGLIFGCLRDEDVGLCAVVFHIGAVDDVP